MNDVQKLLKEKAYASQEKQLKILERLSGIDCGSRNVEGNAKVVEIFDEMLKEIKGVEIEHQFFEGWGTNIVARVNKGSKNGTIVLNGHLDTVFKPGDTAAHPFHVEGNYAWGLGIADCKGGDVLAIQAVRILQEEGLLPDKEFLFIFNCDEEIGSRTGVQTFEKETPKDAEMALVFEPSRTEYGIITARKGAAGATIEVEGIAAHSGNNYMDGRSAFLELAHKALALYKLNDDVKGVQYNVAMVDTHGTPTNVIPNRATARVSVRVSDQADVDKIKADLAAIEKDNFYADGTSCKVTINGIGTPMEPTEKNVALYKKIAAIGADIGMDLPEQRVGGGSDASWFSAQGIPTVDALGPYMYDIHSTNEHLRISSIPERTWLLCCFLASLK